MTDEPRKSAPVAAPVHASGSRFSFFSFASAGHIHL